VPPGRESGDAGPAAGYLAQALETARDPDVRAELLLQQALLQEQAGAGPEAFHAREEAVAAAQDPALKAAALRALAAQEEALRTPMSAARYYQAAARYSEIALELAREPESRAVALRSRGDVLRANGQAADAAEPYRQALAIELDPRTRTELERLLRSVTAEAPPAP